MPRERTESAFVRPTLPKLPSELQQRVFSYLDAHAVLAMSATSTSCHRLLRDTAAPARIALRTLQFDMEGGLARLSSIGLLPCNDVSFLTRFLFDVAGRGVPAAAVGRYITAPRDVPDAEQHARAKELSISFLSCFDFSQDTVAQALRRMLARTRLPPSHTLSGSLLKRLAKRYIACHRQAAYAELCARSTAQPITRAPSPALTSQNCALAASVAAPDHASTHASACGHSSAGAGVVAAAASAAAPECAAADGSGAEQVDEHGVPIGASLHRLVHGFDVASSDADTVYVLIYCCIILNTDMRSDAIKAKMQREDFAARNRGVPLLRDVPASFFLETYDEIAISGLPVSDRVPVAAVRHAGPRQPAPEAVAVLQPLVARMTAARGGAGHAASVPESVRQSATQMYSWLRKAASHTYYGVRAAARAVSERAVAAAAASSSSSSLSASSSSAAGAGIIVDSGSDEDTVAQSLRMASSPTRLHVVAQAVA